MLIGMTTTIINGACGIDINARHISVYVYITVKGSRNCDHSNVLAVHNYVRASMV